jgi:aromatic-L-amino-acid decarboxylase
MPHGAPRTPRKIIAKMRSASVSAPAAEARDASTARTTADLSLAELGRRVREERRRRGLSLDDLAARSRVSRSMISAIERGAKAATVVVLDRLASGLGTRLSLLLDAELRPGAPRLPPAAGTADAADWSAAERSRWEWPEEEIRRVGYRVVNLIAHHLGSLAERPVFQPVPADLAASFLATSPLPEAGRDAGAILDLFARDVEPFPFGNGHPRFYGWVNSPPLPIGIFAEALAAAMNPSCAGGNHAAIYVERQVIDWCRQIVGFPPGSMGLLVSGGSTAALTALAVARHARCGFDVRVRGLQHAGPRLVVYQGSEAHGCHQKAVELLGLGSDALRIIEQDAARRLRPAALDAAIRDDMERGNRPLAVIASAGTVNTGAIDPLEAIADVCARHGVWLHVDGAYGAPAILTERCVAAMAGLGRADSLALDPHKWLYVPVEAGLVLVRDAEAMRAAFSLVPPYLRTPEGIGGLPWFSEYGFQQTRAFRALKVWMALLYHGRSGYRAAIDRDIALAGVLASSLRAAGDCEICEPQSLSIVCFRYAPPALRHDGPALDALNRRVLERIQLGGSAFLTSTILDGVFWLRACIVNPRARAADLRQLVALVRDAGADLAADLPGGATPAA